MHEVAKHRSMRIAHAYMPATNCQWEYHIKQRVIAHFKTTKRCLPLLRFFAREGIDCGKEVAKGLELTRKRAKAFERLNGLLRWPQSLPPGAPEDHAAMNQQHNQEQDYIK